MAMMAALAAVPDSGMRAMMMPPRASRDFDDALRQRHIPTSLRGWAALLPAEVRRPDMLWRALTPIAPLAGLPANDDVEEAIRATAGDIAYQLR
jgi:hypothetical protein